MRIFGLVSGFSGVFSLQPMLFRNFLLDLLPIFFAPLSILLFDLLSISFSPFFFRNFLLRILSFSLFGLLPIFLSIIFRPPSAIAFHRIPLPGDFSPRVLRSNLSFPFSGRILRRFFTFFANYLSFIVKCRV